MSTKASTSAQFSPLAGVRVVDFSSNMAGPYATMILAQLGADVIKVEPPQGDDARSWSIQVEGLSIVHRHMNVGKRGVVIDLKQASGPEIARRLCGSADVVLQSMRPGVASRVGIDRPALSVNNPDLLYYDLSGYGAGAAGANLPGYDPLIQAYSGIVAMNGHDGNPPSRCAPSVIDLGTGQWIAMGVLAAVLAKQRGQVVREMETALIDTAFSLVPYQATAARLTGRRPKRAGSGNPIAAPYQCFSASDGELLIAAPSQRLWEKLAEALDLGELLSDTRFRTVELRSANAEELADALNAVISRRPMAHWLDRLHMLGIPVTQVAGLEESVVGPIARERATFAESGGVPLVRLPWMVDHRAVAWGREAPRLGEHSAEVLRELGYGEAEIEALLQTACAIRQSADKSD